MNQLVSQALAPASMKIYQKAWVKFQEFAWNQYGKEKQPPCSTQDIALFVAYLDLREYAASTIRTYVSAIAYPHKMMGWSDPTMAFPVRRILDSVGRKGNSRPVKLPISLSLLSKLVRALGLAYSFSQSLVFRAIFTMAFHACARIGELAVSGGNIDNVIREKQVSMQRRRGVTQSIRVEFQCYKHSKGIDGAVRNILPLGGPACPVKMIEEYLRTAPQRNVGETEREACFFRWQDGTPVKAREVAQALTRCLQALQEDPSSYSTHGFRLGGTTEAAKKGASDMQLRLLGRWRSNAFLAYVRPRAFAFKY